MLALVSQLPPAHSNCRLLMLMNFDIRITMTGGRVRLAGCSLDWFTEQRMHPGSETCFNMSSVMMMMMVFIFIRIICICGSNKIVARSLSVSRLGLPVYLRKLSTKVAPTCLRTNRQSETVCISCLASGFVFFVFL